MKKSNVIPFPKCIDTRCCSDDNSSLPVADPVHPSADDPKVASLVISDSVFAAPPQAFKWPSAGPVDSRYEKALEEQKRKNEANKDS